MNKNNSEQRVIGHIMFNGVLYEIVRKDNEDIIRLSDLGIEFEKPTREVHYSDLYILKNDKLYLDAIRLENCWGRFSVINGVKAVSAAGVIFYKGLNRAVPYTGTIIVKRNEMGSEQLYQITLNKGKVIKFENIKK